MIMKQRQFGKAGERVVIEECLDGQEASLIGLTDGKIIRLLLASQDHKAIYENDQGLNTGGMGVYAPTPMVDRQIIREVKEKVMMPTIRGIKKMGGEYKGVLYAGVMLTDKGIQVLEFNCRFGDPETQPQMMMLKSDLVELMQAVIGGKLEEKKVINYSGASVCVVMASGGYPGKYRKGDEIKGLVKRERSDLVVFQAGTKLDKGKVVTSGGRVLGVTSRGKSLEKAIDRVYKGVEKIRFKDGYYRRDIGAKALRYLEKPRLVNRIVVRDKLGDGKVEVKIVKSYVINKKLSEEELGKVAIRLINPVVEEYEINQMTSPDNFSWAVEIGFLPGVTDNVGSTVKQGIEDLLGIKFEDSEGVYSADILFFKDKLSKGQVKKLVAEKYNRLIKRAQIKSAKEFKKDRGMDLVVPRVKLVGKGKVLKISLEVDDKELMILGKQGIKGKDGKRRGPLALELDYLKSIREYFRRVKRKPTDIELESLAQTWSEHCKHTIFSNPLDEIKEGIFKRYIQGATEAIRKRKGKNDFCVSVFKDNSGAIEFDENWLVTDKVETHNSPSALDPFGGSITGIVGVNRDTIGFGLGAKPVINRYGFCFNDPKDKSKLYKGPNKTEEMLSSQRIMDGVVAGVNSGGNCSGIPTPQGFVYFDQSYKGKPLVFVGTVGLIPKKSKGRKVFEKKAQPGDYVVMIGGRVGLDGIHGATFSSEVMDEDSPASAVQIGDPITQKKFSDALVKEARDLGLYTSITDNGAGGLSCSVAEMAKECGGCEVDLDKVPVKYPGLEPWQIWISESQERMTLAVPKNKWRQLKELMERRGVEVTVIGKFTKKKNCVVRFKGKKIMDLEMEFLHDGLPQKHRKTKIVKQDYPEPRIKNLTELTKVLRQMLSRLNIGSWQEISQQYDHEVQGGSVIKPLQGKNLINGEATVVKPVLKSEKGVVVTQGINPRLSLIDCYLMAANAIDTAVRNAVAVGVNLDKLALLDNFCWCSSDKPERLYQLKRAAKACYDYAVGYGTPFISGKDSMFNDFKGYDDRGKSVKISVLPTLLVSALGVIDKADKAVSMDVKFPGDLVYVLGETKEELGGSEFFNLHEAIGNRAPLVNKDRNMRLYRAVSQAINQELLVACMSVTKGGLGVALAKMVMAGGLGMRIDLDKVVGDFSRNDYGLFSESSGRLVVIVNPKYKIRFEKLIKGQAGGLVGKVVKTPRLIIKNKQAKVVNLSISQALKDYK